MKRGASTPSTAIGLARLLAEKMTALDGVELLYPVQANACFLKLPDPIKDKLKAKGWRFYSFIGGGSRFMCSWKVTEGDVHQLVADAQ
jgi:threonine aldolase